jgi:glycosyltransferase involved in cell wall biosynthesis
MTGLRLSADGMPPLDERELRPWSKRREDSRWRPTMSANTGTKSIGLCMIVKNESKMIRRCLQSVRPLVDFVLIEDTGSSDGTQDVIRDWLKQTGLPGVVFDEPWRDFAYNRTLALARLRENADIDYALVMDADDILEFEPDFDPAKFKRSLSADHYHVRIRLHEVKYGRVQICSNRKAYRYRGVLHEFIEGPSGHLTSETAQGMTIVAGVEGARSSDPDKYRRDAALLEQALQTETDPFLRSRYTFYLAQSYRDGDEPEKAEAAYLRRAELGFWVEEVFMSILEAARLQEALGRPFESVMATYNRAANCVTTRAEAAHGASRYCRLQSRYPEGYEVARCALALVDAPMPDGLFMIPWVYHYGLLDEYAINAYWAGHFEDCLSACERILARDDLQPAVRGRVSANARFARAKLALTPSESRAADPLPVSGTGGAKRIGLCMIVRNEANVVTRCLDSVQPLIDYVLVEDTGSTDGTQAIIRDWLARKDIPGEIIEKPWHDFATNRSLALARLRDREDIDYALIIDADDTIVLQEGLDVSAFKSNLVTDLYNLEMRNGPLRYHRPQICSNRLAFHFRGVLHEYLEGPADGFTSGTATGLYIRSSREGNRSNDTDKYRNDAEVLERALETEEDPFLRSRYTFYLARSYHHAEEKAKAIKLYLKRAELGYWEEEVFVSLYSAARLQELTGQPFDEVVAAYLRASDLAPGRAEALHAACRYCRVNDRFAEGYEIARRGLNISIPEGGLFVEPWVYDYGILDEFAVLAYWTERYQECLDACQRLLTDDRMPRDMRGRVEENAKFAAKKLAEEASKGAPVNPTQSQDLRPGRWRELNEPELNPGRLKLLLICGPWGSGTSAVAGILERIGVSGLAPYFMTNDKKTPNSYESVAFRNLILQHIDQSTLSFVPCAPGGIESSFESLQRRIEEQEFGPYDPLSPKPIFLKHPLSALLIPQLSKVFDIKLIFVMRSLADIETSRRRRKWSAHFGAEGARIIYQHMAQAQDRNQWPISTIHYQELLASPIDHARKIAHFAGIRPSSHELGHACNFITPMLAEEDAR